jgi:hypothetical protein
MILIYIILAHPVKCGALKRVIALSILRHEKKFVDYGGNDS